MLQKLLCKLGSHIWVVSHKDGYNVSWSCDEEGNLVTTRKDIKYCLHKCLCCNKEKKETLN